MENFRKKSEVFRKFKYCSQNFSVRFAEGIKVSKNILRKRLIEGVLTRYLTAVTVRLCILQGAKQPVAKSACHLRFQELEETALLN